MKIALGMGSLCAVAVLLGLGGCRATDGGAGARREVGERLDALHGAASRADFAAYFECFADEGVFLGTDARERWTVEEFRAYCKPSFEAGKGWTYAPRDRHVRLDDERAPRMAWFDELLENEKYGTCRGSGVLVRGGSREGWKVVQYNLSFMVPNEKAAEVTAITRGK